MVARCAGVRGVSTSEAETFRRVAGQEVVPASPTQYTVCFQEKPKIGYVHTFVLKRASSVHIIQGKGSDLQPLDQLPMSSCSIPATALLADRDFGVWAEVLGFAEQPCVPSERAKTALLGILHLEPTLDALRVWSDIISPIKIRSLFFEKRLWVLCVPAERAKAGLSLGWSRCSTRAAVGLGSVFQPSVFGECVRLEHTL